MPEIENRKTRKKGNTLKEHTQTIIIPQLSPEVLEQARKAAAAGKTSEEIEQEALAAAERQHQETAAAAGQAAAEPPRTEAAPPKETPRPRSTRRTRSEAEAELAQSIHDDHLWLNNPVMVRGLGLAPVVAAAISGQTALMLCAASVLLLTTTRVLAVAVCHLTGNRFRGVIYSFSAALLYIPAYLILSNLFGSDLSLLGIYLPMLVVEPAITKRMEADELETIGEAFRRGINNTIGLCISTLLIGCLRELLADGTVFGRVILPVPPLPLADKPGAGFIIVGLIAAVWTAIGGAYVHYKLEEVRHLYADRKR
ncbi:MAG: Rnf-Nqr domain containing protein [Gemmiger sp.]|uniref:Rnf-Nqr domain containing protein n=1 Tax=Gemmiger sp. TaxID=2049027 RepID=UPI002E776285|nr:Rnf-Nqr domain containing protein [Gemmiger sp.]MEE0800844.1 Rnf-Nqr domain containing protein [Gemmiger sp.]